jgi:hypothetical protein
VKQYLFIASIICLLCLNSVFAGKLTLDVSVEPEFQKFSALHRFDYTVVTPDTSYKQGSIVLGDYSQNNFSAAVGIAPGYMVNDRLKFELAIEHRFQEPTRTWRMQTYIAPRVVLFAPNFQPLSVSADIGYCAWYNAVVNDLFLACDYESIGYSISLDYYIQRNVALSFVVHNTMYEKINVTGIPTNNTIDYEKMTLRDQNTSAGLKLSYNVLNCKRNRR